MKTLIRTVEQAVNKAFAHAFPHLDNDFRAAVTRSTQAKFGHYQCNSAMALAKPLKQAPRAIAEAVAKELSEQALFESVEIAGPGFINLRLTADALTQDLQQMLARGDLGISKPTSPERIVIDFSSPNIAKEMHVGHLRSTIIGDALSRLFELLGHDVVRLNHVGDWGTAFGMLIAYLEDQAPAVLSGEQSATLTDLVGWYKAAKARFDEEPAFKKRSQQQVVSLQAHEQPAYGAWQIICEISEKAYQEIYDLLDVQLTVRGESFYNPFLAAIVQRCEEKGIVSVSEGAKCIYLDGFVNREGEPLPFMIQKSDGGYNYATTDLAALDHRVQEEKADRIIYVTDAGQQVHFQMLFASAERAGLFDPSKTRVDHVTFGLVLGPDGKKFKTRSGETERLIDLLNTAVSKAHTLCADRELDLDAQELDTLAHTLGIGAVKYADLSGNRTADYTFSYDRMLRFEGNTAAFLLYAYVRIESIKRKIGKDPMALLNNTAFTLTEPAEVDLALQLRQFGDTLETMAEDLMPNRLTDYLYTLANSFNQFFRDCRVQGHAQEDARLLLCELTAQVLKAGLSVLGLHTAQKM